MASITLQNVTRSYPGSATPAVRDLNLSIDEGEFLVMVGPSGCGKTTTLRMIAGLEPADSGRILFNDTDITNTPPDQRNIAMVFQNYALYPHMTVAQNIGFHLKISKTPRTEIIRRVNEVAQSLELTPFLHRKPDELSGGQRQRVAMARAIIRHPDVFLMDEPLSNLDASLRTSTRTSIARLQHESGTTTVYVTHDQTEAMTLGHRVALFNAGQVQQVASPQEMYVQPANAFVAGFLGHPPMNIFHLPVNQDGGACWGGVTFALPRAISQQLAHSSILLGVRPENITVAAEGVAVTITAVEYLGSESYVHCSFEDSAEAYRVDAATLTRADPQVSFTIARHGDLSWNDHLYVMWDPREATYFDPVTGTRLQ